MGIFFNTDNEKLKSLLEVEINGEKQEEDEEEDYTKDTDNDTNNNEESNTDTNSDDEEDYTAGIDSAGDDDSDDDTSGEENTDDTSEESNTDDEEDYTAGIDSAGDDDSDDTDSNDTTDSEEGSDSSDDEEDYTAGVDSAGDESNDTEEDTSESDESSDNENNTDNESSEDDSSFENLKKIEAELFSNLTPEQIAIKNYELKQNFINLYAAIGSTLTRINDIAKYDYNIETIKFITDKLLELREMIDFNITTAYQTRTYIENNIIYQQCLSTLNAISDIIQSIPNPIEKNKENDDDFSEDLEDSENKQPEEQLQVSDTNNKMIENTDIFNDYI